MKVVALTSLFGLAAGNFVSPGLEKCLDIERTLQKDGKTRNTIEEMQELLKKDEKAIVNVQLYDCHSMRNQNFEITGGTIVSQAVGWCLESGRQIEQALNVRLGKCTGAENQQWDFTGFGYIKNKESGKCLDIRAEKKEDGTREMWDEIKERKTVNVQLYDCHDPEKTKRLNQLWEWAPVTGDKVGVGGKFELSGLSGASNNFGAGALTLAAVLGSVIMMAGMVVGMRMRVKPTSLLQATEE